VALIAGATFGLTSDSLFPGLAALLPTLGAVLIIVAPLSWINRVRAFQPTDDPARPDQLPALSLALGAPGLPLHSAQR
jgi:hypothetical protein